MPPKTVPSSVGDAINLKSLLKLERYAGEKEKFQDFKWQLYVAVRVLNAGLLTRMEWVEKHLDDDFKMENLSDEDKVLMQEAHTLLALLCTEQALEYVKAAEDNNGFDAWKQLCRGRILRSSVALLNQLLDPKMSSTDPRVNIRQWQREVREYQSRTGDVINDVTKKSIYMNKLAPEAMRQHLRLNQSRLLTSDDVVQEIEEYLEACDDGDQMMTGSVNAIGHVNKGGHFDKKKGKGQGQNHGGKGKQKSSLSYQQKGKKSGSSEKGKNHKGLGKEAPRGEQRRFGGQCSWCWRIGHKESQCWFKQAYDQENGKGGGTAAPATAAAGTSQTTLEHWRKRPAAAEAASSSSSAMEVGAIQVAAATHRTPFCFALTEQETVEEETAEQESGDEDSWHPWQWYLNEDPDPQWYIEEMYGKEWETPPLDEASLRGGVLLARLRK